MVETIHGVVRDKNMEWTYTLDPELKIGYIHIESFSQGEFAPTPTRRSAGRMKKTGLNGLVIDVRNNPAAAAVAEM